MKLPVTHTKAPGWSNYQVCLDQTIPRTWIRMHRHRRGGLTVTKGMPQKVPVTKTRLPVDQIFPKTKTKRARFSYETTFIDHDYPFQFTENPYD